MRRKKKKGELHSRVRFYGGSEVIPKDKRS